MYFTYPSLTRGDEIYLIFADAGSSFPVSSHRSRGQRSRSPLFSVVDLNLKSVSLADVSFSRSTANIVTKERTPGHFESGRAFFSYFVTCCIYFYRKSEVAVYAVT